MTKIGQRNELLSGSNPWWRDPLWHDKDSDLKEARDNQIHYNSGVLDNLLVGSLYILRGPRRVGKTIAVKQAIKGLIEQGVPVNSIIRLSAEGLTKAELKDLLVSTPLRPIESGVSRYWFIDEISSVQGEWDRLIKNLRDESAEFRAATVVLTGSNAPSLTAAAGTLSGRRGRGTNLDRTLLPIGFATFVALVSPGPLPPRTGLEIGDLRSRTAANAYEALNPWIGDLVKLWETYLGYGGFPLVVAAAKAGIPIPDYFINTMFDVIQKDAFRTSNLDVSTSTNLQSAIWKRTAIPLIVESVADEVSIQDHVVSRHLRYLRDSFLLWSCPKKKDGAWVPMPKARAKIYAIDPIVARLAHLRNPNYPDIDITVISEMQVGMALKRRLIRSGGPAAQEDSIFYFTSATRKEIDFVAECLGSAALEGKYTENDLWPQEAGTVNASVWDGILLTRNVLDTSGSNAWAVPTSILCYLLDT